MPGIRRMPARNSTTRPAYTTVMLDGQEVSMPVRRWGAGALGRCEGWFGVAGSSHNRCAG